MKKQLPTDPRSAYILGAFRALYLDEKFTQGEAEFFADLLREIPELNSAPILELHSEFFKKVLRGDSILRSDSEKLKQIMADILEVEVNASPEEKKTFDEIPFDEVSLIDIFGSIFVVTGQFNSGRWNVEEYIQEEGGEVASRCSSKIDYLIVGDIPDESWKFGNYGTKVKKAVDLKTKGHNIKIISESIFEAKTEYSH
jgi:NAD-dependent DNA ligase